MKVRCIFVSRKEVGRHLLSKQMNKYITFFLLIEDIDYCKTVESKVKGKKGFTGKAAAK